jgi:hypothetical protein
MFLLAAGGTVLGIVNGPENTSLPAPVSATGSVLAVLAK